MLLGHSNKCLAQLTDTSLTNLNFPCWLLKFTKDLLGNLLCCILLKVVELQSIETLLLHFFELSCTDGVDLKNGDGDERGDPDSRLGESDFSEPLLR